VKWIIAIIKPHKLDDVRSALAQSGVQGITVTEVKGFGRQKGHVETYRGAEYEVDYVSKLKLEIAVGSEQLDDVLAILEQSASTGTIGDGKIFTIGLGESIRIRTGEGGLSAIQG